MFYNKQLEKIQASDIDIKNKEPLDIIKELVKRSESIPKVSPSDIRDRLEAIKVDIPIAPNLFASFIDEKIKD